MRLDLIAVTLSILALAISLTPTLTSLMTFDEPVENKPSFDMPVSQYHGNVILGPVTTSFRIANNGSAVAHDVHVLVYFDAHSYDIYLEKYLPELSHTGQWRDGRAVYFPVGYRQLEMAWGDFENYTITVRISCREVPGAQHFEFHMH